MDEQLRRLRRDIARAVIVSSIRVFLLGAAVTQGGFVIASGGPSFGSLPTSLVVGQMIALAHVGFSATLSTNGFGFLEAYIDHRPFFGARPPMPADDVICDELAESGLLPVVTVHDDRASEELGFDIYKTENELVTAAVGRESGTLTLLSRLADDRIAVTSRHALLPHHSVVHRRPADGTTQSALAAHRELLAELTAGGSPPRPSPPWIFTELDRRERDAWRELGPFAGSFVSLSDARPALRISVAADGSQSLA